MFVIDAVVTFGLTKRVNPTVSGVRHCSADARSQDAPPDMEARRQIARFVRDLKERARRGWDAMDRMWIVLKL